MNRDPAQTVFTAEDRTMLTFWGSPSGHTCDGHSRRDFLRIGALGAAGLTLSGLLRTRAAQAAAGAATKDTSVVWLWLGGGPTHIETFDPKMDAPAEFRSTVGAAATSVPGVHYGSVFPRLAEVADRVAVVRSFAHQNSGHGGGTHWVMTGYDSRDADNGGKANRPAIGSIVARVRGANHPGTGLPTYVRLNGIGFDGPAWLGAAYAPFDTSGQARKNMDLALQLDRVSDRRDLLKRLDHVDRAADGSGLMNGLDAFEGQAFNLVLGSARQAFDIKREDPAVVARYGKGIGEQLLMARRLCEAGCGFVTLNYGGWDMHGNIVRALNQRCPALDQAVAAFVRDTVDRGLDQKILLVITGEFGRTPRVNAGAGRDHWAPLSTLALAGGGLRMGQAIGESSAKAEVPKSKPITPQDLMATVFHVLGIEQSTHFADNAGRPTPMLTSGKPIGALV